MTKLFEIQIWYTGSTQNSSEIPMYRYASRTISLLQRDISVGIIDIGKSVELTIIETRRVRMEKLL